MTQPPDFSPPATPAEDIDWASARGDRWRTNLVGMEAMLAPIDTPLLRALRLEAPVRIAEIGSGGGATARALLRAAPRGSIVDGYDISAALVEHARAQSADEGIAFHVANAASVVPTQPYDRLVSRFGVMFFPDAAAAFANLRRFLVPGGRFAFAVWGAREDNLWLKTVRDVVTEVATIPPVDPEGPNPFRYQDVEVLRALLGGAGFDDVTVEDWRGALSIGGALPAPEAARFALAAFSSFGEVLAEAGEAAQQRAQAALATRFAKLEDDSAVRLVARVHIVSGRAAG
jgi:SAM-dependent methyltransferase